MKERPGARGRSHGRFEVGVKTDDVLLNRRREKKQLIAFLSLGGVGLRRSGARWVNTQLRLHSSLSSPAIQPDL